MTNISFKVTLEQYQRLEALAATQQTSVDALVRELALAALHAPSSEEQSIEELESLLDQRLRSAQEKGPSDETLRSIFREAYRSS